MLSVLLSLLTYPFRALALLVDENLLYLED